LYITASCQISNRVVYKNGKPVYENSGDNVSAFLVAAYRHFGIQYPKFFKMDNLSKLGWLAAELLLQDDFDKEKYQPEAVGVILANASSSLDTDLKYYETVKEIASPALFVYTLPNIVTGEICIRHKFKGENAFFVAESFDADFIEQYVSGLVNNGVMEACICGWVELMGEQYKTVLFLVEKMNTESSVPFSGENIYKTFI